MSGVFTWSNVARHALSHTYQLYRSTPGNRLVPFQSAAVFGASETHSCSPHAPSLWRTRCRDRHDTSIYPARHTECVTSFDINIHHLRLFLFRYLHMHINLPRQHTQHQVEHKERADDDEGDEVHPVPCTP